MSGRVGVYTQNFRFYHDILKILKAWKIPFVSLSDPRSIPMDVTLVLSSDNDEKLKVTQVRNRSAIRVVREAVPYLLGRTSFSELVVGIDPGPKPGIAVFGDGVLTEAFESPDIEHSIIAVREIRSAYLYKNLRINIGDGDRPNGQIIAAALEKLDITVNIVDERNTSQPHKMHNNALSAARIAQGTGYPVGGKNDTKIRNRDAIDFEFTTLKKALSQ